MPGSLLDSNVWVAAAFPAHDFHDAAMDFLRQASPAEPALFCRVTELSVLRLLTSPRLLARYGAEGVTNRHALAALAAFKRHRAVGFLEEPPGIAPLWHHLAASENPSPKVWLDAYLAAFAIRAGLRLATMDRDFARYEREGLRLIPLGE